MNLRKYIRKILKENIERNLNDNFCMWFNNININENTVGKNAKPLVAYHGTWWNKPPHTLKKDFHLGTLKSAIDRLTQEKVEGNTPTLNSQPRIYRYEIIVKPDEEIYADPMLHGEETYKVGKQPIQYENDVEDKGSISYIVKSSQVKFIDEVSGFESIINKELKKRGLNEIKNSDEDEQSSNNDKIIFLRNTNYSNAGNVRKLPYEGIHCFALKESYLDKFFEQAYYQGSNKKDFIEIKPEGKKIYALNFKIADDYVKGNSDVKPALEKLNPNKHVLKFRKSTAVKPMYLYHSDLDYQILMDPKTDKNIFKEDSSSSSQILYPAKYMTGMEDVSDLERTMNKMFFYVDRKYTDESDKKKTAWANSVDLTEPIGVHIGQHGDVVFNDGYHRVLAARILNKSVPIIIENNRMKPEIFDVFMDRIKKGFTPVQINPDGVNLNYTNNYKIPSIEVMEQGRKLNTSRDILFQFYMSKQDEEKLSDLSEVKKKILQPKPLSEKIFSQAEMVKMGGNYNLQHGMLMMIPVNMIDGLDPEPASWLDDSGEEHDFEKGQKITKPIEVGYDDGNNVYMMWDGNHRVLQAKTNGDKYIKAFVQADSREIYNGWKRLFNSGLNENIIEARNGATETKIVYHGTSTGAAIRIAREGHMKPGQASGSINAPLFFSNIEQYASTYASRKDFGGGVLLRVKKTPDMKVSKEISKKGGYLEYYTFREIPVNEIEIKTKDGWKPIDGFSFINEIRNEAP